MSGGEDHAATMMLRLLVLAAGVHAAPPLQRVPQIHFTPPCFTEVRPPHDIAAALYDPKAAAYTVMPGCWHAKPGGWQQLMTKDLVSFALVGEAHNLGGSGGLLIDEDGDMVAYADSVSMWRVPASEFYKPATLATGRVESFRRRLVYFIRDYLYEITKRRLKL
jgi:hypothetical protein